MHRLGHAPQPRKLAVVVLRHVVCVGLREARGARKRLGEGHTDGRRWRKAEKPMSSRGEWRVERTDGGRLREMGVGFRIEVVNAVTDGEKKCGFLIGCMPTKHVQG